MYAKKMATVIAMVFVLSMVLASCAPSASTPATTAAPSADSTAAPVASSAPAEQEDLSKEIEITYSLWGCGDWAEDEWIRDLQEKMNIRLTAVGFTWNDWTEKLQIWAASDQLPDIFAHDMNYFQWASQEALRGIDLNLLDNYPNLKATIPESVKDALTIDGKIYSIPRSHWMSEPVPLQSLYINKEWLARSGLAMPNTVDDWYEMLKKFVADDYAGNGKTIGIVPPNGSDLYGVDLLLIIPFVPNYQFWIQEDGKWIPGVFSKDMVKALEYGRKLYKEGLLYKDFALIKQGDGLNLFSGEQAGVTGQNAGYWDNLTAVQSSERQKELCQLALPPLNVHDGKRYTVDTVNYWSYTGINPKVDDEKLARILTLYEYLVSPEGLEFSWAGVEGRDFTRENGQFVSLLPKDSSGDTQTLTQVYPTADFGRQMASWSADASQIPEYCGIDANLVKDAADYYDLVRAECASPGANFSIALASTPAKDRLPSPNSEFYMEYQRIVIADEDVETMWNRWVSEQTALYQEAIDEVNALFS